MAEVTGAVHEAGSGAMSTLNEVVGILFDIVLPIVLLLTGIFTYSWLGGASSVAALLTKAGLSSGIANHVAPLVPAAIGFSIGGGFWYSLGRHKNIVAKAIGKLVGAYFLGLGFGYVLNAAFGNVTTGVLDGLITQTGTVIGG